MVKKDITIPKIIFYSLVIGLFATILIFVYGVKDGNKCLSSPLNYGAEKALETSGGDIFCSCRFTTPNYNNLYFNDKIMTTKSFSGVLK